MKFTLGWLREYLDTDATLDRIVDRLTALGLEVESVVDRGAALAPFTVARVTEARPHPDADRLRVCRVDAGKGEVDVVCGAPNARAGMKGVFAPLGARLPGTGTVLEKRAIRGVTGLGMLCSERELGLSDDHEGIVELPDDAPVGAPFAPVLGLDDPVIDLAVTPDRGDCLGVLGVARDLAAAGLGRFAPPPVAPVAGSGPSRIEAALDFPADAAGACPLFVGRTISGVRNRPSPAWLQNRLRAAGLRPVSALVDITNLVTLERARPLHVFDADRLSGNRLCARLARAGETLEALDGRTHELDPDMTVIADGRGPAALAGIVGGMATACTPDTVNVFLESALFDPVRTAATGRKLRIESDARHRFERGVDRAGAAEGAERATRLILDLCGGEASDPTVAGAAPGDGRPVRFRPSQVHALGGLDMPPDRAFAILEALGFAPEPSPDRAHALCRAPSWRHDIDGEADLVEEVLRVEGYDAIPAVSPPRPRAVARPGLDPAQRRERRARRAPAARGLDECVTWSFLSADAARRFGGGAPALRLVNPIGEALTDMRPSLLPNLAAAAARNRARGRADFGLFEVGPVYAGRAPEDQTAAAGGVRCGATGPRHWLARPRPVDAFDAKADALALVAALGGPAESLQTAAEAPAWYRPGQSGALRLGPRNTVARFGMLHPRVAASFDLDGPVAAFEVFLDRIPARSGKPRKASGPDSGLQPVRRDFAFVVDAAFPAGDLLRLLRGLSGKVPGKHVLSDAMLFDDYRGEGVAASQKSLAVSLAIHPRDRTMTDDEIRAVADAIVARVCATTGGRLRA